MWCDPRLWGRGLRLWGRGLRLWGRNPRLCRLGEWIGNARLCVKDGDGRRRSATVFGASRFRLGWRLTQPQPQHPVMNPSTWVRGGLERDFQWSGSIRKWKTPSRNRVSGLIAFLIRRLGTRAKLMVM